MKKRFLSRLIALRNKKIFSLLLLILVVVKGMSQTGDVIPPSPNAATFLRFGDYPVDQSTGLANVSLPIYNIQFKDFSFPIALRFHASGRRPSEEYSPVGVGWMLDATGSISREVRERPDESYRPLEMSYDQVFHYTESGRRLPYDILIAADMNVPNGQAFEGNSEWDKYDSEHDLYSYNVNGMSGKFVIEGGGSLGGGTEVPLTYTNCKIMRSQIWDEKGNKYEFGTTPESKESVYDIHNQATIMSRFLSKITLTSGEVITFTYKTKFTGVLEDNIAGRWNHSQIYEVGEEGPGLNHTPFGSSGEMYDFYQNKLGIHGVQTASYTDYSMSYLTQINFPNGIVTFTYDDQTLRLTSVVVKSFDNNYIKRAFLDYIPTPGTPSTYNVNNQGVSLSAVRFKDNLGADMETYSMNYYDDPYAGRTSLGFANTDWWGYCNLAGNLPPFNASGLWSPGIAGYMPQYGCTSCKEPNFSSKRSGMIKKITYPTGGSTEFEYEPNYYFNTLEQVVKEGPGLRIAKITSDAGFSTRKIIKTYKYGQNENGQGFVATPASANDFYETKTYHDVQPSESGSPAAWIFDYTISSFTPYPRTSMQEAYSLPLYYDFVTEYTSAEDGTNNGKHVFQYSRPQYIGTSYNLPPAVKRKDYAGAKLVNDWTYSYRADQHNYQLLEQGNYGYWPYHYHKIPQVKIWRTAFLLYDNQFTGRIFETDLMDGVHTIGLPFSYIDWPIEAAVEALKTETHYNYQPDGSYLSTVKEYTYNDNANHMNPIKVVTTTSIGGKTSIETKYSRDFYPNNEEVVPLETSAYRMNNDETNKRLIGSKLTSWDFTNHVPLKQYAIETATPITDFAPLTMSLQSSDLIKDNRYVEKLSFNQYDANDNILEMQKTGDIKVSYIWDGIYPVAKVTNAAVSDIAYTSFEGSGKGNWTYLFTPITQPTMPTGSRAHELAASNISKSVNSATTYILSYWRPVSASGLTVAGTQTGYPIVSDAVNGWKRYEHKITGVSSVTLSGSGGIDEVRLYPVGATMTTYTYSPLIGMTSQTDVNNKTTYYEYDSFNRLKTIKDQDGNIIKTFLYNYKK